MSHHPFRLLILLVLVFLSGTIAAGTSTLTLITLSGPGSQSDTAARYFSHELEQHLGQRVVVVNSPGGEGVVGMRHFINNGVSCDSMMLGNASVLFAAMHQQELGFDAMKQFVPIHGLAESRSVIVVPTDSPVHNLKELVTLHAKEQRLIGGSISPATSTSMSMLDESLRVKTDVIRYKTTPQMLLDLVGGRLDYSIVLTGTSAIQGLIETGKLRVIAGVDPKRHPAFPAIPTIVEQGYAPIEVFYWGAFFVNDNTPASCQKRLQAAVRATLYSATGEKFSKQAGAPQRLLVDGEQMGAIMRRQLKQIALLNAR